MSWPNEHHSETDNSTNKTGWVICHCRWNSVICQDQFCQNFFAAALAQCSPSSNDVAHSLVSSVCCDSMIPLFIDNQLSTTNGIGAITRVCVTYVFAGLWNPCTFVPCSRFTGSRLSKSAFNRSSTGLSRSLSQNQILWLILTIPGLDSVNSRPIDILWHCTRLQYRWVMEILGLCYIDLCFSWFVLWSNHIPQKSCKCLHESFNSTKFLNESWFQYDLSDTATENFLASIDSRDPLGWKQAPLAEENEGFFPQLISVLSEKLYWPFLLQTYSSFVQSRLNTCSLFCLLSSLFTSFLLSKPSRVFIGSGENASTLS